MGRKTSEAQMVQSLRIRNKAHRDGLSGDSKRAEDGCAPGGGGGAGEKNVT